MAIYLYDAKRNVTTETNYELLSDLTGRSIGSLRSSKSRKRKINELDAYIIGEEATSKDRQYWYANEVIKGEMWKPLEGSVRGYFVSSHGRFKRVQQLKFGRKETFIMPYVIKNKAHEVKVDFGGVLKAHRVSILVAHHFIRPRAEGEWVYHKNRDVLDNWYGNLEYLSKQEVGRRTGAKTKRTKPVVLLGDDGEVVEEYSSVREAGRNLYMSYQTILDNCHGRTKSAAGYQFRFSSDYYGEG